VKAVFQGRTDAAFCVVRPPGHHCGRDGVETLGTEIDLAQGFCFVNNVAVIVTQVLAMAHLSMKSLNFAIDRSRACCGKLLCQGCHS
jgi:acetoin utilization deacetylase AcuC-like enzyme